MILVDLNQIMISNLMRQIGYMGNGDNGINENLVRHMVLNSLRKYRSQFKNKYGEMILCCDNKNYWRKQKFPYYKASRKKTREESDLDWPNIFESLNRIKDELSETFPYKTLEVESTEADDIIAIIVKHHSQENPILILSGDKDFVQLQKYPNVAQYSPIQKKYIRNDNPQQFIKELIMRGDRSDGVPNFLSKDDTFMNGGRQRPLIKRRINEWLGMKPEEFCTEEMLRNYKRNEELIDLDFVPESIEQQILEEYDKPISGNRSKLMPYFIDKQLKNLMENIGDF
jgi:5'-3' exonuclease